MKWTRYHMNGLVAESMIKVGVLQHKRNVDAQADLGFYVHK